VSAEIEAFVGSESVAAIALTAIHALVARATGLVARSIAGGAAGLGLVASEQGQSKCRKRGHQ